MSIVVHRHGSRGATFDRERRAHLRANCACAQEQHYEYRWDELNRLDEARRFDRTGGPWSLAVRQRHRYDSANQRTVKQTLDQDGCTDPPVGGTVPCERIALYPYPGDFERRGLVRGFDAYEANADLGTETQYLIGGARLVHRHTGAGATFDRERRLTLAISDLIQTTSAVLDVHSGALLECSTYYPNGARETFLNQDDVLVAPEPMGFTGKEADEEVGLVYFGERYLVPRLGRWASPDPLHVHAVGGGEALNSYHYVSGSLLAARDPLGLDVYVGLVGGTDAGDGTTEVGGSRGIASEPGEASPSSAASQVEAAAREAASSVGTDFNGVSLAPGLFSSETVNLAADFVEENWSEGERVVLYGYSRGGAAIMDLAEELGARGINVDLLVTVDAYFPGRNYRVSENVEVAINYYQTQRAGGVLSRGWPATADSANTRVYNVDLTGQVGPPDRQEGPDVAVRHENIDEATSPLIQDQVRSLIGGFDLGTPFPGVGRTLFRRPTWVWEPRFRPEDRPIRGARTPPRPPPCAEGCRAL